MYEEKYHDTLENLVSKRTAQTLKHQICRGLSNITAGTIKQIQAVVDANLIPALVKTAKTWDGRVGVGTHVPGDDDATRPAPPKTLDWSVRKEAGYALANAVSGGVGKDSTVTIRTALQTEPVVTALCDVALTAMEMRIVDAVNVSLSNSKIYFVANFAVDDVAVIIVVRGAGFFLLLASSFPALTLARICNQLMFQNYFLTTL